MNLTEKLAAHNSSMFFIKNVHTEVARMQQTGDMAVPVLTLSPEALAVFNAFHEAVRKFAAHMEKANPETRQLHSKLWPAMMKFMGKAFGSLCVANVGERLAMWRVAGPPGCTDNVVRFPDALAAAFKLLLHMASQAYCESHIANVEGDHAEESSEIPHSQSATAFRLSATEADNVPLVAARLVECLCTISSGLDTLKSSGVRGRISNSQSPVLRRARTALGCSADAWANAVTHLCSVGVFAPLPEVQ